MENDSCEITRLSYLKIGHLRCYSELSIQSFKSTDFDLAKHPSISAPTIELVELVMIY